MSADRDKSEQPVRCACPVNVAGDIRCHKCREYVNVRCWNCKTPRGEGTCPSQRLADAGTTPSAPEPSQATTEAHGNEERVARYVEAVSRSMVQPLGALPPGIARAVMAVADAEQAELRAEVERLRRWKAEAAEVILGLQDVGRALGVGLGEQITGRSGLDAAKRLIERAEAAEAKVARVEALAESLVWKRPEKSPCAHVEACCGSEDSCDAMHPSVRVVGHHDLRAALRGDA